MKNNSLFLDSVTFVSPQANGWDEYLALLNCQDATPFEEDFRAEPESLPIRSQRRLSPQILLAISVAEKIHQSLPKETAWVFASSVGEGETLNVILNALGTPEKAIQPLRFQNSVHNAASGQWTIAAGVKSPVTSINADTYTAGAGFLKASMQMVLEDCPVGLVLYDAPLPYPLSTSHKINIPLGVGFALKSESSADTIAELKISYCKTPDPIPYASLPQIPENSYNPILAVLPLLRCLAGSAQEDIFLGLNKNYGLCIKVKLL